MKWKPRPSAAIRGGVLNPPAPVAARISKQVQALISVMIDDYRASIKSMFETGYGHRVAVTDAMGSDFSEHAGVLLKGLGDDFESQFAFKSSEWSKELTLGADKASDVQVRTSLKEIAQDITLKPVSLDDGGAYNNVFSAITQESANLFKTIAKEYHDDVQAAVMRSIVSGNGWKDLQPFFESHSNGTKNYAKLRVLDQTRKAFNGLARARMENAGVKKFEWIHTSGSKEPRELHKELSGKFFDFDSPPFIGVMYKQAVYGFPGDLPYCRCRFRPVIVLYDKKAA